MSGNGDFERAATRGLRVDSSLTLASSLVDVRREELAAIIAARTVDDGCTDARHPGVRFHRVSRQATFRKAHVFGPTLTVSAQGAKVARFGAHQLAFDPSRYLVVTGETAFEATSLDATTDRPYLAVCVDIPSDLVAKTLLALAAPPAAPERGEPPGEAPPDEMIPAFVSSLDGAILDGVVRLVKAIEDPTERRIVAPLVLEELVFRLLRSDAAAVVRSAVGRSHDAEAIREAMRFIRANAERDLSVDAVARHVAMSPSHSAHRFRAVARVSPMRYLKQHRLQEARALMLAGGLRVSEAATRVGYESASHFTRDFKATFGAAPAEYVRRVRAA